MAVAFWVDFGTEKQHVEFVEYISSEYEKKTFVYYHPTSPPHRVHATCEAKCFYQTGNFPMSINLIFWMKICILTWLGKLLFFVDKRGHGGSETLTYNCSYRFLVHQATLTTLCKLYCWQNDTDWQQTLQIPDIADRYKSGCYKATYKVHTHYLLPPTPIPKLLFLIKYLNNFIWSAIRLLVNSRKIFEMRDWLPGQAMYFYHILYCVSGLRYWGTELLIIHDPPLRFYLKCQECQMT